ncbi:DgyrCDS13013 [Dimorphilus gyrociliatus]|uniref:DgyrCDS13013 n=1 Tax=Dimorphilus gyrociliatus TaxID=2664684 RepID=A0A7I8W9G0_9ANNE|nr:DgyrCDS13013 [Dimorphilus gyrociliatus]
MKSHILLIIALCILESSKNVICGKIPDGTDSVHGEWSQWTNWNKCSAPCGNGVEGRVRNCSSPPQANGGKDCVGKSLEERPCNNGPCAEPAFMVSLKSTMNVYPGVMNWTSVDLNVNEMFDPKTNRVSIKKPGLYFFSMITTSPAKKSIDVMLENTGKNVGLYRRGDLRSEGAETLSRSGLFVLSQLYKPVMKQMTSSMLYSSENGRETSWLGFHYVSDEYLFCGSHRNLQYGTVQWPFVSAMKGFQENSVLSQFKASKSGLYFLNAGMRLGYTTANTQYKAGISINVDRNYNVFQTPLELKGAITSRGLSDTFSRSVLTRLTAGDVLRAEAHRPFSTISPILSGRRIESYMAAFRLNENLPYFQAVSTDSTCREFRRINLKSAIYDSQRSWNSKLHEYNIKKQGIYYIEFTLSKYRTSKVDVRMFLNKQMVAVSAKQSMIDENKHFTRSTLLNLKVNDKIHWENYGCVDSDASVTIICTSAVSQN